MYMVVTLQTDLLIFLFRKKILKMYNFSEDYG